MAPGVPLGNKLVLLIIEAPPPVGGKGTSLEHLSQSLWEVATKCLLSNPSCFDLLGVFETFVPLICFSSYFVFFLIGQDSEDAEWG